MTNLLSDVRAACRSLWHQPRIPVFVVATLALAIGANVAIFTVVRSVLLRPLPFADPERLVRVWSSLPREQRERENASPADFLDWQAQSASFEGLAYWRDTTATLVGHGDPVELPVELVSANFFSVLGVEPSLGRAFLPAEAQERVVVLGFDLWQERFGGARDVIGSSLTLNRESYTVVGVMPRDFAMLGRNARLWIAQGYSPGQFRRRRYLEVIGRLAHATTVEQAQAQLQTVASRLEQAYPDSNSGWGVRLAPLHEVVVGPARAPLRLLAGSTALVLLIACGNVAALLLARATGRERELALRSALGASRVRLARLLLIETGLLALVAGAASLPAVHFGLKLLLAREPGDLPRVREVSFDPSVLAFTAGICALAVVLSNLVPVVRGLRFDLDLGLRDGAAPRTGHGPRHRLALRLLTVGEVALATVLLLGSGLLLRSFWKLRSVEPGFDARGVLVGRISLDKASYPEDAQVVAYFDRLRERLHALPGVSSVAVVTALPLEPVGIDFDVAYETGDRRSTSEAPQAAFRVVTPGYFATLGIPLREGRDFSEQDRAETRCVVVVNQRLAESAWAGRSPLGRPLTLAAGGPQQQCEVVGTVGDVHHYGLGGELRPEVFVPQRQQPWYSTFYVVLRTASSPRHLSASLTREALNVDPKQPITDVREMEDVLAGSLARERFLALLLGLTAGVALLLSISGTYAVLSYGISQRRQEIGVRLALGGRPIDMVALALREGTALALAGGLLGGVAAQAMSSLVRRHLFGVQPHDLATHAGVAALLLATALLACSLPAARAASVDPARALRYE